MAELTKRHNLAESLVCSWDTSDNWILMKNLWGYERQQRMVLYI